jgi:hypothetical protein
LLLSVGLGEEKGAAAGCPRSNEEPAFIAGERRVLKQVKSELLGVELESFIVVADDQSQVSDGLGHDFGLWHFDDDWAEEKTSHRDHRGRAPFDFAQGKQRARRVG